MSTSKRRHIFCTFADSRLTRSLKRIETQARRMGCYSDYCIWTEANLDPVFLDRFSQVLVAGVRGFGYWVWKPQVILQAMRMALPGDIIHYVDAGCWLNPNGKTRLNEYFHLCDNSPLGIMGFQIPEQAPTLELADYTLPERRWTKGDLLDRFGIRDHKEIVNSNQVEATSLLIRCCPESTRFVNDWLHVFDESFSLVDDSPSVSPNLDGFIEHRHDQSVLSILMKLHGAPQLSSFEYCYPRKQTKNGITKWTASWDELAKTPIWAKRDKDIGIWARWNQKLRNFSSRKINMARQLFRRIQK